MERATQGAARDLRRIKFNGPLWRLLPDFSIRTYTTEGVATPWPAANRGIFIPFVLEEAIVTSIGLHYLTGINAATHNASIGIYKVEDDHDTVTLIVQASGGMLDSQPNGAAFAELSLVEGTHYVGLSINSAAPLVYAFDRTCFGTDPTFMFYQGIRSFASSYPLSTRPSFSLLDGNGNPGASYIPALSFIVRAP